MIVSVVCCGQGDKNKVCGTEQVGCVFYVNVATWFFGIFLRVSWRDWQVYQYNIDYMLYLISICIWHRTFIFMPITAVNE